MVRAVAVVLQQAGGSTVVGLVAAAAGLVAAATGTRQALAQSIVARRGRRLGEEVGERKQQCWRQQLIAEHGSAHHGCTPGNKRAVATHVLWNGCGYPGGTLTRHQAC